MRRLLPVIFTLFNGQKQRVRNRRRNPLPFLIPLLFVFAIIAIFNRTDAQPAIVEAETRVYPARVESVIDGDTVNVLFLVGDPARERIRLIGVDAPEIRGIQRRESEPFGDEAREFAMRHLQGRDIWLQFDMRRVRDRWGRIRAYIWLHEPTDVANEREIRTNMFNAHLLLNGYARVMLIEPYTRNTVLFQRFEQEARNAQRNIWEQ